MKVDFLRPKFPKFFHIKNHFALMYKHNCFSNNGQLVQGFEKRMKGRFCRLDGKPFFL